MSWSCDSIFTKLKKKELYEWSTTMKLEFSRDIVNEANGIQENLNTLRKEIIQSEITVQIDTVLFLFFIFFPFLC